MHSKFHTIGELSALTAISVRRIRFYSDKGLLPPAARTEAGYRVYSDADVARLDLIRSLREAGASLSTIQKTLSHDLSLADVLAIRLKALDAEIASKRRIATALRAIVAIPNPTTSDLRRLWTMTILSNAQMRATLERFYERLGEGAEISEDWRRQMVEHTAPELPDNATPGQIDAWNEIASMVTNEHFIEQMQAHAKLMWNKDFDPQAYIEASKITMQKVDKARDAGEPSQSPLAREIAREWVESSASAMKRAPDAAFIQWHLSQYDNAHSQQARYYELLTALRGEPYDDRIAKGWSWLNDAIRALTLN